MFFFFIYYFIAKNSEIVEIEFPFISLLFTLLAFDSRNSCRFWTKWNQDWCDNFSLYYKSVWRLKNFTLSSNCNIKKFKCKGQWTTVDYLANFMHITIAELCFGASMYGGLFTWLKNLALFWWIKSMYETIINKSSQFWSISGIIKMPNFITIFILLSFKFLHSMTIRSHGIFWPFDQLAWAVRHEHAFI